MTVGPGVYDPETTELLRKFEADAIILMVLGGNRGEGFSAVSTMGPLFDLPKLLRFMADRIEKDLPEIAEGQA